MSGEAEELLPDGEEPPLPDGALEVPVVLVRSDCWSCATSKRTGDDHGRRNEGKHESKMLHRK